MGENLNGMAIGSVLFDWLSENIKDGSNVLELGSGEGTIELAKKYNVTSIEHNDKWINLTDNKYILAPMVKGWYSIEKIKDGIGDTIYDLIIVDGPIASQPRDGFIKNLKLFNISNDSIIIIDDIHRSTENNMFNSLKNKLNRNGKVYNDGKKKFGVLWGI